MVADTSRDSAEKDVLARGDYFIRVNVRAGTLKKRTQELKELVKIALQDRIEDCELQADDADGSIGKFDSLLLIFVARFADDRLWQAPITRGPIAQDKDEVQKWRTFWGARSELRRFGDGTIGECVEWSKTVDAQVPQLVVEWVLEKKLGLNRKEFTVQTCGLVTGTALGGDDSEGVLNAKANARLQDVFAAFSQRLHSLQLPLTITAIQPMSSYLRGMMPHALLALSGQPQLRRNQTRIGEKRKADANVLLPCMGAPFQAAVDVAINVEASSKWGRSPEVVRALTTAFYISMAKAFETSKASKTSGGDLTAQSGEEEEEAVTAHATTDGLYVYFQGVVFRIALHTERLIVMLKSRCDDEIGGEEFEKELVAEETRQKLEPMIANQVSAATHRWPALAPTICLVRRWLSAQMLLDHFHPLILETLVCVAFLRAENDVGKAPRSPVAGLRTVLEWLGDGHDFRLRPVVLDFVGEKWTAADRARIELETMRNRASLPALVVCLPVDETGTRLTSDGPSATILKRTVASARFWKQQMAATLKGRSRAKQIYSLFVPIPTSGPKPSPTAADGSGGGSVVPFDYEIGVHRFWRNLRASHLVDYESSPAQSQPLTKGKKGKGRTGAQGNETPTTRKRHPLPVVDSQPVREVIKELRRRFGASALFLYDFYMPHRIGVLLMKAAREKGIKMAKDDGAGAEEAEEFELIDEQRFIDEIYTIGGPALEYVQRRCT